MDLEAELEEQKEVTRRMEDSARATFVAYVDKVREHTTLITMIQNMLAEEEPKEIFVEKFMVFLGAIDNGDLQTLQRFDEKDMMITISKMRNNDAGDMGGLECFYGDLVSKIGLGLEEKATMDAILATVKASGSSGGRNGGFSGEYGDDFLKTKLGFDMVKNSGSRGDNKSELADGYEREGGMVVDAIEEEPNSEGNGVEAELRRAGEYRGNC
ncbi:hypothetical protein V6N13_088539 [Hibiscus sabdariffa]|uniref:Uncharacterized protein n=1 Tax=Hibiscus sabdariffa TaxID=183260 RepID=A0ABR2FZM2_9ROSI